MDGGLERPANRWVATGSTGARGRLGERQRVEGCGSRGWARRREVGWVARGEWAARFEQRKPQSARFVGSNLRVVIDFRTRVSSRRIRVARQCRPLEGPAQIRTTVAAKLLPASNLLGSIFPHHRLVASLLVVVMREKWAGADSNHGRSEAAPCFESAWIHFPASQTRRFAPRCCDAGKVGRRRFELRLRPPEGRRMPSYPTGPHSRRGSLVV